MFMKTGKAFAVTLVFLLGACQSTDQVKLQESGFHIINVGVALPDQESTVELLQYTDGLHGMMTNVFSHYASTYNATRPNAKTGYGLKVNIEKVHFKVGLGSAVPGDANHILGSATLVRLSDNQTVHTVPVKFIDGASAVVGGVSGVVLSMIVTKEAVERNLAQGAAEQAMGQIYPNAVLSSASKQHLKSEAAFQPLNKPISPLSRGSSLASTDAGAGVSQ